MLPRRLVAALCALVCLIPLSHASAGQPATELRGVHVVDGQFVDAVGRTVHLRGINAVGKQGSRGSGTPNLTAADVRRMRDMGFDVVRLGMVWDAVEPRPGRYDDAMLTRVVRQLDLLHSAGLLAVVDMHQDAWSAYIGSDGAPGWAAPQCHVPPHVGIADATGQFFAQYASPDNVAAWQNFWADGFGAADPFCTGPVQSRFVAMWRHVAQRLARHPAVIGYDVLNEPFLPAGQALQLNAFYRRVTTAIRQVDKSHTIFFEPPLGAVPALGLEAPDPNSAYAPHIYTETMFSGGAVSTGAVTDARELAVDQQLARAMGAALWIGEWGEVEIPAYNQQMYDVLDAARVGDSYWAYTEGGQGKLKSRPPSADLQHTRPYVAAAAGDAAWSFDPSTRRFAATVTVGPGRHTSILVLPTALRLRWKNAGVACSAVQQRCLWTVTGPGTFAFEARP
jgi:endoglycosylceramidase